PRLHPVPAVQFHRSESRQCRGAEGRQLAGVHPVSLQRALQAADQAGRRRQPEALVHLHRRCHRSPAHDPREQGWLRQPAHLQHRQPEQLHLEPRSGAAHHQDRAGVSSAARQRPRHGDRRRLRRRVLRQVLPGHPGAGTQRRSRAARSRLAADHGYGYRNPAHHRVLREAGRLRHARGGDGGGHLASRPRHGLTTGGGAARGPARLAGACLPLVFAWVARLYGRDSALLALTALAVSPFFVIVGHLNLLDGGFTFWLTAAVLAFTLAQTAPPASAAERGWMLTAWGAAALAVLSKGIVVGVLAGAALILYTLGERDTHTWRRLHPGAVLALFAALAAPWFVVVSLRNPSFPGFFFVHEHFTRFLTTVHQRVEPWWYFLPLLL